MKLKYFFASLVATVALFTSCTEEFEPTYLDGVSVSSSYVAIPVEGGSQKIILNADEDWCLDFDVQVSADSLSEEKGKVDYKVPCNQLETKDNNWFTVSPANGKAGKTEITFTAPANGDTRSSNIKIKIGDKYQELVVAQIAEGETPMSTIKDVIAGPDAKTYKVKGTCTNVYNTNYGNWYMEDEEGNQIVIYGTLYDGKTQNNPIENNKISVGDVVTVEGPKTTYNGTIELVDVTVLKVDKALLSTKEATKTIVKDAGDFTLSVKQLGEGLSYASECEWITIDNGYTVDKAGNLVFQLHAQENTTGASRQGTVVLESTKGNVTTKLPIVVTQLWQDTKEVTVAEFAAEVAGGAKTYDVTLKDAVVTYKNGSNFFIEDATGGILLYDGAATLKVGDKINGRIWGKSTLYNNLPELTLFRGELAKIEEGKAPAPKEVAYAELVSNFDRYISCYISVKNATVGKTIDVIYSKVNSAGSLTDGTNELALNHQSTSKYNGSKIYYYVQAEAGSSVNVVCVPTVYKTNKQLNIWDKSWIKAATK